jgi:hypothetical protein
VFVCAKVNACCKENAQGDEELVSADQRTSDVAWRRFSYMDLVVEHSW